CTIGTQHLSRAEQQASRGTGSAILNDPRSAQLATTRSDAEAKAGQRVIEMDQVGLACRQLGGRDRLGGELHAFRPPAGEAAGKRKPALPCPIPATIRKLKCHGNRQKTSAAPLAARFVQREVCFEI